eukprot:maker-scaffold1150_size58936-snap-gene-0.17 protein:Tk05051 transcript:maker-scaffold1150_size58936-snap-gene-0.17-mRNA-1 annotation:"AGAP001362-PA"
MMRKTVDYNSSFLSLLERRVWQRDPRDRRALQPDNMYVPHILPPMGYLDNPANAVTTKFVKTATNKMRCPVFTLAWTPEGRRLITGASSGEFTLWNGLTFNFETILQAHDTAVRSMVWSPNDQWMVTGDHGGYIKYWQSNMNNVKMFQAHKEPVRCVSFAPTNVKFATCSDDGTVRVWDFYTCQEERVLRGHGSDVKCVDWHPTQGLLASGSKDNQQPIKIWDAKSGKVLTTLHAHKSTVMDIEWNRNGNWLLTASRDHLIKLFDIRNTKEELQTFRGHKKEASTLAWHPIHEGVFASGGSDGSIMFWNVGADKEVGAIEQAHDSIVWSLGWHPIGHILCSGSNDHTCKFWTRNRPGDTMRDKYNLNTLPAGVEDDNLNASDMPSASITIPGMAPEDRIDSGVGSNSSYGPGGLSQMGIPGLDPAEEAASGGANGNHMMEKKKVPYAKPIPKQFQNSWNTGDAPASMAPHPTLGSSAQAFDPPLGQGGYPQKGPSMQGGPSPAGCISLQELQRQATAVVAFGQVYPVLPGSNLFMSIPSGEPAVRDVLRNEFLPPG